MALSLVGTVASALLCVYVGALALRISSAPGFTAHRAFGVAALSAALYAALNVVTTTPTYDPPPWLAAGACSLQVSAVAVHALAWARYAQGLLERPRRTRAEWWLGAALSAAALVVLVPGLAFRAEIRVVEVPSLASRYLVPEATPLAHAVLALATASLAVTSVRLAAAVRRGVEGTGAPAAALAALCALLVHDALVSAGVLHHPFVSDLALFVPVAAAGLALAGRVVACARSHEALRLGLSAAVEQRTEALQSTQANLVRTEKLAVVGRFAAGVAHQVAGPLAAIGAALAYLEETRPQTCEDTRSAISDAKEAVGRITSVTRRLRDASRLAAAPARPGAATRLVTAAHEALALARAGLDDRPGHGVPVEVDVPATLWVAAEQDLVVEVLSNLVANAAEATAGRPGSVRIRAHAEAERIRICVEDDGPGMPPEVLAHVFEPFFSTKKDPAAPGLGLAVSRGLVASVGGDLAIETEPGRGTRAWVDLRPGAGPT